MMAATRVNLIKYFFVITFILDIIKPIFTPIIIISSATIFVYFLFLLILDGIFPKFLGL